MSDQGVEGVRITKNYSKLARKAGYRGLSGERELLGCQEKTIEGETEGRIDVDLGYSEVVKKVELHDRSKVLTGKTPERIEEETGMDKDYMFPIGKKILYIGDPWQRMGKEMDTTDMTLIDYEYGESASFEFDDVKFRSLVSSEGSRLLEEVDSFLSRTLTSDDRKWFEEFKVLVTKAHVISSKISQIGEYKKASDAWKIAIEFLNTTYKEQILNTQQVDYATDVGDATHGEYNEIAVFRTNAWYKCIHAERGFKDIPDYFNIVYPKILNKETALKKHGMNESEIEQELKVWRKIWIEEIRLKKHTKNSNVVEGIFPELPFASNSFERIVASWSISAHAFSGFDSQDFTICWKEVERVLKRGGLAFIFPLNYALYDKDLMINSLKEYCSRGKLSFALISNVGTDVEDIYDAETLQIIKE